MGDISKILLGALIALSTSVVGHVFVARQNDLLNANEEKKSKIVFH